MLKKPEQHDKRQFVEKREMNRQIKIEVKDNKYFPVLINRDFPFKD